VTIIVVILTTPYIFTQQQTLEVAEEDVGAAAEDVGVAVSAIFLSAYYFRYSCS
jgi:hypothetical protein